jgi:type VI secretion system secreted protein Hcp
MLVTNEPIKTLELRFYRHAVNGGQEQHYTVTLTNARITSISFHQPNADQRETIDRAEYEDVAIVYESIEWRWNAGGIVAGDHFSGTE